MNFTVILAFLWSLISSAFAFAWKTVTYVPTHLDGDGGYHAPTPPPIVPEPSTLVGMGIGTVGLVALSKRRAKKNG